MGERTVMIRVRLTPEEHARYVAAAGGGRNLSGWMRRAADERAGHHEAVALASITDPTKAVHVRVTKSAAKIPTTSDCHHPINRRVGKLCGACGTTVK